MIRCARAVAHISVSVLQLNLNPMMKNPRAAEGLFPKYRAWYLPSNPVALTSGAGPRGSFS